MDVVSAVQHETGNLGLAEFRIVPYVHLDMMKVDTEKNEISLYRYKEPIRHRK